MNSARQSELLKSQIPRLEKERLEKRIQTLETQNRALTLKLAAQSNSHFINLEGHDVDDSVDDYINISDQSDTENNDCPISFRDGIKAFPRLGVIAKAQFDILEKAFIDKFLIKRLKSAELKYFISITSFPKRLLEDFLDWFDVTYDRLLDTKKTGNYLESAKVMKSGKSADRDPEMTSFKKGKITLRNEDSNDESDAENDHLPISLRDGIKHFPGLAFIPKAQYDVLEKSFIDKFLIKRLESAELKYFISITSFPKRLLEDFLDWFDVTYDQLFETKKTGNYLESAKAHQLNYDEHSKNFGKSANRDSEMTSFKKRKITLRKEDSNDESDAENDHLPISFRDGIKHFPGLAFIPKAQYDVLEKSFIDKFLIKRLESAELKYFISITSFPKRLLEDFLDWFDVTYDQLFETKKTGNYLESAKAHQLNYDEHSKNFGKSVVDPEISIRKSKNILQKKNLKIMRKISLSKGF
jgi:hypothetical protein